jgi:hypothetical protein
MPHQVLRVSSTVRIPDPARRLGQIAPLETRWRETVDRIRFELPRDHALQSAGNGMKSELALDDLQDAFFAAKAEQVAAAERATAASPEIREACRALSEYQRQWNSAAIEIKAAQRWLEVASGSWQFQLAGLIGADCFVVPHLYSTSVSDSAKFHSVVEARQAVQEMLPRFQVLRSVIAKIKEAKSFEALPAEQKAIELIRCLVERQARSHERIIKLESQCAVLEMRLDRLERGRKKKSNSKRRRLAAASTRSSTSQIGSAA